MEQIAKTSLCHGAAPDRFNTLTSSVQYLDPFRAVFVRRTKEVQMISLLCCEHNKCGPIRGRAQITLAESVQILYCTPTLDKLVARPKKARLQFSLPSHQCDVWCMFCRKGFHLLGLPAARRLPGRRVSLESAGGWARVVGWLDVGSPHLQTAPPLYHLMCNGVVLRRLVWNAQPTAGDLAFAASRPCNPPFLPTTTDKPPRPTTTSYSTFPIKVVIMAASLGSSALICRL